MDTKPNMCLQASTFNADKPGWFDNYSLNQKLFIFVIVDLSALCWMGNLEK